MLIVQAATLFLVSIPCRALSFFPPGYHDRSSCERQPSSSHQQAPSQFIHRRDFMQAAVISTVFVATTAPAAAAAAPVLAKPSLVETFGDWLVAHPAPAVLVNNPVKRWFATATAGAYDEVAERARLDSLIAADDVVLFTYSYDVAFGRTVRVALEAEGVDVREHDLDRLANGQALVAEITRRTGRSSIPSVFVAGESIGGCNDGSPGVRPLIAQPGGLAAALEKCSPDFRDRTRTNRRRLGLPPL